MNDLPIFGIKHKAPEMRDINHNALKGEECGAAKLTEEQVRRIKNSIKFRQQLDELRKLYTNEQLAKRAGVSHRTIERIASGETWGHVE